MFPKRTTRSLSMALRNRRPHLSSLICGGQRAGSQPETLQKLPLPDGINSAICLQRQFRSAPDAAAREIFRRFLQRRMLDNRAAPRPPEIISLPAGDKPREEIRGISTVPGGDLLRLHGISIPAGEMSVDDARKVMKMLLVQRMTTRLRELPESSITYGELVRICSECCGGDGNTAGELVRAMDESSNVIVLGDTAFLRPQQVAKSMEALLSQSIPRPNDPRRQLLERMETQKVEIDSQARAQVRAELYGGLGLMVAQTAAFMRLTFWELSWDVMEPICFFAASLHFAAGYAFFLRTAVEPSFEGFFQQRFRAKQRSLMAARGFDLEAYDLLRRLFYPTR